MIRVRRPRAIPAALRNKGPAAIEALCAAYDAAPEDYRAGTRTFDFDREIYAAAGVKDALLRAQHDKCAFCESKLAHVAYGDVEHFRPKKGWVQADGDPLARPGYYWLAYVWENLLLSCQLCNQRHKRNLFPLTQPAQRARCHHDDCGREAPVFVNPAMEEPAEHIAFRAEIPHAVPGSARGERTIACLGLRREALNERRREKLALLAQLVDVVRLSEAEPSKIDVELGRRARETLARAVRDDAEYAAMARALVQSQAPVL